MKAFGPGTLRRYGAIDILPAFGIIPNELRNRDIDAGGNAFVKREKTSFIYYHASASLLFYALPAAVAAYEIL